MKRRSGGRGGTSAASAKRRRGALAWVAGHTALIVVVVVMVLGAMVRWRLADTPLERDEGEYAYAGQLILQGVPPYLEAYNMKFPGTYYAYAATMALFGETPRGIRLGLILVNAGTALLLFAMGRRLFGGFGGVVTAVSFVLLALDRWNLGIFAHATHFVLLPALAGLYLLMRAPESRRALWFLASGLLLGIAVIMKQHAAFFLPLGTLLLIWEDAERRRGRRAVFLDLTALIAGAVAPVALLCAVLWRQGVLDRFWFWAFQYARAYVSQLPARMFLPDLQSGLNRVTPATWWFWLAACVGLIGLWAGRWRWGQRVFVTGLLVTSFAAICPGFFFRDHYFILLLPALALLDAVVFVGAARLLALALPAWIGRLAAITLFAVLCAVVAAGQSEFLFAMSPQTIVRTCYGFAPFIESVEVGKFVRAHTTKADRIAVVGSEPEIYFYAHRRSATGYLYAYPFMEPQPYALKMQAEMMAEVRRTHPKYIVFVQETSTWNMLPNSDPRILGWMWRYVSDCYRLAGLVDMPSFTTTRYLWGDEARGYKPSPYVIFVYERNSDAPCTAGG